jgi:cell division protein FtsB
MVADFNKKTIFRALGISFLLLTAFLLFEDAKIYRRKINLKAQIAAYQKQIDDIKKSSQNLKDEIANSDNKDYLEKLAYEQLGQQRPGEKQIIFVMPEEKHQDARPKNFWESFSGWFPAAVDWIKSKF